MDYSSEWWKIPKTIKAYTDCGSTFDIYDENCLEVCKSRQISKFEFPSNFYGASKTVLKLLFNSLMDEKKTDIDKFYLQTKGIKYRDILDNHS